jgi:hypothetical protein
MIGLQAELSVIDLNLTLDFGPFALKGMADECRTDGFCPDHGFSASQRISQMHRPLRRTAQGSEFFLHGSVSVHGICPTELSRESAGYRGLFACGSVETVSHGHSRQHREINIGLCQRDSRLAYLFRPRSSSDTGLYPTGLMCDQTILLSGFYAAKDYPEKLRRIRYADQQTGKTLVFLTNCFSLEAIEIARLYKCRWQVELFFKWIKQHLRIKAFFGTSENAVKTQIWIAVSVYVLVAIIKKQLKLELSLYTILQILSVTLFEKVSILQVLMEADCKIETDGLHNQLNLFEL